MITAWLVLSGKWNVFDGRSLLLYGSALLAAVELFTELVVLWKIL